MLKRAATVAAVCGLVGVALAMDPINKAKIVGFEPSGTGVGENPDGDGTAHFTYDSITDTTEIRVTITGFLPNTTYGVSINSNGLNDVIVENLAITTNPAGNGSWRWVALQDQCADLSVVIFRYNGDFDTSDIVTSDEVRAIGAP